MSHFRRATDGDPIAWIVGDDTGISSKTIWAVMMGKEPTYYLGADAPYDAGDFGRCYRLLNEMPSWRARLPEVAAKYLVWAPLVAAWDELTSLYETDIQKHKGFAPNLDRRISELRGRA